MITIIKLGGAKNERYPSCTKRQFFNSGHEIMEQKSRFDCCAREYNM